MGGRAAAAAGRAGRLPAAPCSGGGEGRRQALLPAYLQWLGAGPHDPRGAGHRPPPPHRPPQRVHQERLPGAHHPGGARAQVVSRTSTSPTSTATDCTCSPARHRRRQRPVQGGGLRCGREVLRRQRAHRDQAGWQRALSLGPRRGRPSPPRHRLVPPARPRRHGHAGARRRRRRAHHRGRHRPGARDRARPGARVGGDADVPEPRVHAAARRRHGLHRGHALGGELAGDGGGGQAQPDQRPAQAALPGPARAGGALAYRLWRQPGGDGHQAAPGAR